jgi:ligand-binding SRPBCC domain-containing protein
MLYLAMLRAAGLKAYAVKVVDRDKGIFDPRYLDADELDSTLVMLSTGGRLILLDPGEKMCPFETVNWRHSFAAGLGQSAQGPALTVTPQQQYADNIVRRTGTLALDAQGGVTGQIQIAMTGQEALHWRQTALENDQTEVNKQFDEELETIVPEGVHAHVDHFVAIDDPNASLVAVVNIDGTFGVATARRLVIPSFFFETRERIPFVHEEKRMELVDMHYASRVTDQVTYRLPAGMTVEGAPRDTDISWPDQALFVAKSLTQASQITIAQTLTRAFTIIKPEDYQELRGFYQKVATADQQQIVLDRANVIAGKAN